MPKIGDYPDGSPNQDTDVIVAARNGVNTKLVTSAANGFGNLYSDDTQTLTNKTITPRVVTVTVAAEPAINTDNGEVFRIGVAGDLLDLAITSMTTNLTGTPTHGQKMTIEFLDDGTGRAITWGASFRSTTQATLPSTTVASTLLHVGLMYDSVDSKWDCVCVANESGTGQAVYTYAGDSDGGGLANYTVRMYVPAALVTTNGIGQVRARFYAASGEAFGIQKARIGLSNAGVGDDYDYQAAPKRLLFSGSASTLISIGSNTWSDWAQFNIPPSTGLIVAVLVANNAAQDGPRAHDTNTPGCRAYRKAGDDIDTVNATGYTAGTDEYIIFALALQLQSIGGNFMALF